MCLIFVGQGYPRKLFNLEHFPIYGIASLSTSLSIRALIYRYCITNARVSLHTLVRISLLCKVSAGT